MRKGLRSQPCFETKWRRVCGMPGVTKGPSTGSTTAVDFEDHSHKDTTDTIVQLLRAHPSALITSRRRFNHNRKRV